MAVCESCWAVATFEAHMLGGSVVDRYQERIKTSECPDATAGTDTTGEA